MTSRLSTAREKWVAYRLNFPEQTAAFEKQNGDVLEKSHQRAEEADEEDAADYLEDALKKLRVSIAGANSAKELGGTAIALGLVIQALGGQFGLELEGPKASLSEQIAANEEAYSGLAKELLCKYGMSGPLLEPEARLCIMLGSAIGSVHTRNACALRLEAAEKAANGTAPPPLRPLPALPAPAPTPAPKPGASSRPDNVVASMGAATPDDTREPDA